MVVRRQAGSLALVVAAAVLCMAAAVQARITHNVHAPNVVKLGADATCSCVHGTCSGTTCNCDAGWIGADCQYCISSEACSNHGQCVNAACQCNPGWVGSTCSKPTCNLPCEHGGTVNPTCQFCVGCLGAWDGTQCNKYNQSRAGIYKVYFPEQSNEAKADVARIAHQVPRTPIPGWRLLGFSYDITTGGLSAFPALGINFTNPQHVWTSANGTKYLEPDQMTVTTIDATGTAPPTVKCTTFETVADLFAAQQAATNSLSGVAGFHETDPVSTQTKYFPAKKLLTLCTAQYPIYKATSPPLTTAKPSRWMADVLASMPSTFDNSTQSTFSDFTQYFGTHYLTTVTMGGQVYTVFQHARCLVSMENMPVTQIQEYSQTALMNILAGRNWTAGLEATFAGATRSVVTNKLGGIPTQKLPDWTKSLVDNPVPIAWTLLNMNKLAANNGTQLAIQQAVNSYVASANAKLESALSTAKSNAAAQWLQAQPVVIQAQFDGQQPGSAIISMKAGDSKANGVAGSINDAVGESKTVRKYTSPTEGMLTYCYWVEEAVHMIPSIYPQCNRNAQGQLQADYSPQDRGSGPNQNFCNIMSIQTPSGMTCDNSQATKQMRCSKNQNLFMNWLEVKHSSVSGSQKSGWSTADAGCISASSSILAQFQPKDSALKDVRTTITTQMAVTCCQGTSTANKCTI